MMQESVEGMELTEKLVLTRTRAPDLDSVRKLNCWASNISNVEVVRQMPNLEVCSLSINRISSLRDFAHCRKLKELYVRTNNIQELGDVHYLKNLPRLRSLWLSENPCANAPNYRSTVLRSLPNLQKLDNKLVTPEEVETAQVEGDDIPLPEDFSFSCVLSNSSMNNTQSSVGSSLELSTGPRRKREQRRQKLAAQEGVSKGKDEESSSSFSKSEEEQSACEESTDANVDDFESQLNNHNNNNSNSLSDYATGLSSSIVNDDDDDDKSELSNNSIIQPNASVVNVSVDSNVCDSQDIQEKSILKDDENRSVSESSGIEQVKGSECIASSCESLMNKNLENRNQDSPLLDKIRLDDSLNCAISEDVSESIALDDLILEIKSDKTNDPSADQGVNNEDISDSISVDESNDVTESVDQSTPSASIDSTLISSTGDNQAVSAGEEVKKPAPAVKSRVVDWEEHNRLRAELGVKQMERTTPRASNNDLTRLRNTNILQAVLSLVKELDKDSLDIVSSAVQSRLEKL